MTVRSTEFVKYENNKNYVRYEFDVDAASELAGLSDAINEIDSNTVIAQGSIAWVIGDGEFYGMNSEGQWINQTGGSSNE